MDFDPLHPKHIMLMSQMRRIAIVAFIVAGIFALLTYKYLIRAPYVEVINSFDVKIEVQENREMLVTENIVYDFGHNKKIGITRYIPLTSRSNPRLDINVLGVEDELGNLYQYESFVEDDVLVIKIGNMDSRISGIRTYKVTYKVGNTIIKYSNFDEVYWNVTGSHWPAAIKEASALIILPGKTGDNIKMDCFTGPGGSTERNCRYERKDASEATSIHYSTTKPLMIIEGFTILLDFPLGLLN